MPARVTNIIAAQAPRKFTTSKAHAFLGETVQRDLSCYRPFWRMRSWEISTLSPPALEKDSCGLYSPPIYLPRMRTRLRFLPGGVASLEDSLSDDEVASPIPTSVQRSRRKAAKVIAPPPCPFWALRKSEAPGIAHAPGDLILAQGFGRAGFLAGAPADQPLR